jgi:hypothetical protein
MNKYALLLSVLIGVSIGSIGSLAALAQLVAKQNASLTCERWQVRDDYRSAAFGRVAYCRDLPTKSVPW